MHYIQLDHASFRARNKRQFRWACTKRWDVGEDGEWEGEGSNQSEREGGRNRVWEAEQQRPVPHVALFMLGLFRFPCGSLQSLTHPLGLHWTQPSTQHWAYTNTFICLPCQSGDLNHIDKQNIQLAPVRNSPCVVNSGDDEDDDEGFVFIYSEKVGSARLNRRKGSVNRIAKKIEHVQTLHAVESVKKRGKQMRTTISRFRRTLIELTHHSSALWYPDSCPVTGTAVVCSAAGLLFWREQMYETWDEYLSFIHCLISSCLMSCCVVIARHLVCFST